MTTQRLQIVIDYLDDNLDSLTIEDINSLIIHLSLNTQRKLHKQKISSATVDEIVKHYA